MLRAVIVCVLVMVLGACTSGRVASEAPTAPDSPAGPDSSAGPNSSAEPDSPPATDPPAPPSNRPELTGAYDEYVALGDSFTAGPLIAPEDPDGESCGRSLANYPHLLAARLEVETLRDVSCSGASTTHLSSPQTNVFGTSPPQFRALSDTTDLVTLGIGGNDFGVFGRLITACARARATDPDGAPCSNRLAGVGDVFDQTGERVTEALEEIQRRSPDAEVLLVGYPRLAPDRGTCPDVLPFAAGDYAFATEVQRRLNQALRSAAREAGVEFVDVAGPSVGHDACAGEQAWVNGRRAVQGEALSYHPLDKGMAAVADLVYAELG